MEDQEKLNEVGLEPDKPRGNIRAIWALTLIAAFAIFIGGAVYFILWYSPLDNILGFPIVKTTDDTSDWQTYTNDEHRFRIKYPDDWEYGEYINSDPEDSAIELGRVYFYEKNKADEVKSAINSVGPDTIDAIQLIINNKNNINYEEFISSWSANEECTSEDKEINSSDVKYFNCQQGSTNYIDSYVTSNEETVLILQTQIQDKKAILDKMIETLEFSEISIQAGETADWKTYTDENYSFSCKYPPQSEVTKSEEYDNVGDLVYYHINFRDKTDCGNDPQCAFQNFIIHVYQNRNKWSAKEYVDDLYADKPQEIISTLERSKVTVDGLQGEKVISQEGHSGSKTIYIPLKSDNTFMIGISYDGTNPDLEAVLSAFLENFKMSE